MKYASNSYLSLLEEARQHTNIVLPDTADILKRLNGGSINSHTLFYILDFTQKMYLEVGPGNNTFLGYTTGYLRDMGPYSWLEKWNIQDFKVINKLLIPDNIHVIQHASHCQFDNVVFTYNYRVKTKFGDEIVLLQRTSYVLDAQKNILAAIGTVTDITRFKSDNKIISLIEEFDKQGKEKKILHHSCYFPEEKDSLLSKREIEVLKWICEGLSSKEIAAKMHISFNTVNNHRRNMLQKTNCGNFASLLQYAINNGIL